MATESPQRAYRAACPNCGAPVDFRSAASAFAVCSFCRSTLLREGDALRRTGESAELFDDHTPLQLGASGVHQGAGFTLVGRLQYRYADGTWNEWHALFDTGRSGWLSEDNGRYVIAFDRAPDAGAVLPAAESLRVGAQQVIDGQPWSVASVTVAKLIAALGELPTAPVTDRGFVVADLRSTRDEVGTIDYRDPARPTWSIGRSVALAELRMTGLAADSEKTLSARSLACPSCGAAIEVKLASTQSVSCQQCHAVVDVSQGVGGDLAHYAQDNGDEPLIPLGTVGRIAFGRRADGTPDMLEWQVVGYAERCEVDTAPDDDQVFWREYLLYHRTAGFTFLVDAEDGWSWAAPITGVPQRFGDSVKHDGVLFRERYRYSGKVTYVIGEFYWRLQREQRTANIDYVGTGSSSTRRLNREQTGSGDTQEVVWSAGATLAADTVRSAFKLPVDQLVRLERDATPFSSQTDWGQRAAIIFFVVIVALMVLSQGQDDKACDDLRSTYGEASQEYQRCVTDQRNAARTGGGAYGGYSTGGGHK